MDERNPNDGLTEAEWLSTLPPRMQADFAILGGDDPECPRCGSSQSWESCESCGGDGYVEYEDPEELFDSSQYEPCDICNGTGGWWQCLSSREWCEAESKRREKERQS